MQLLQLKKPALSRIIGYHNKLGIFIFGHNIEFINIIVLLIVIMCQSIEYILMTLLHDHHNLKLNANIYFITYLLQ